MGAAEESFAHFDSVANYPAFAVLANRGHSLNRTLEVVEDVTSTRGCQFETLVVSLPQTSHGFGKAKHASPVNREQNDPYAVSSTDKIFPAGSLNHAIVGPFPREIPRASVFKFGSL
jgi:hypothetical protein